MPLSALPTCEFTTIAPAGFRLLAALQETSIAYHCDLIITSACDGAHSGPDDPHYRGCAYDVRSHDFSDTLKQLILTHTMDVLGVATEADGGWVTNQFFGWLEQAGTASEHFHFQLRHGASYP